MIEQDGQSHDMRLAEWRALADRPAFGAAARQLAANMLQACDEHPRLSAVFKDAGRYMTAMSAAYLDGSGGLTLGGLKQICAASGFLSPGRAKALLGYLIHIGYLETADRVGAAAAYRPTADFTREWGRHLQLALEAAGLIDPAAAGLALRLAEPGVYEEMLLIQAARLHALSRAPDVVPQLRRAFVDRDAGSQMLWVLIVAEQTGAFPPAGMLSLSLSAIARRFAVSHVHVRRLLEAATLAGLLSEHGRGNVAFSALGLEQLRVFYASQLHELTATASAVISARDPGKGRSRPILPGPPSADSL